ncbi:hypothetical protein GGI25_002668 [Coemansia spiralis]|uniref:YCII-related domain-containing protein n=2 Tax=Coemansia TaxID=4863 RepID=A0A9W8KYT3_9FUNG|nr:hypothetical protein BX070DRAFT_253223 [Coemansia spiralis]KAJ1992894.1 hypothetical protein EDC05_002526 [Coemansia umbellata]KAJ2622828.1 hypothetical protein GGI26_002935 [Coemansia sp. RSA 1358]KAJ2678025.1 hypothetical protein GGI25_002668 [Coemansia spiralis]
MSTSAAEGSKKKTFVVIIDDHKDAEALNRRLSVRQMHLAEATSRRKGGFLVSGGAILDSHASGKMIGSALICSAESEEQVVQMLMSDPYTVGKAWDMDSVRIYPYVEADF